jgi:xanthine/CO dehydrogenase XdhC/CoxF family maturation factor
MKELPGIVDAIAALREPAVLATLVRAKGSSYRKPGARMIFNAEGLQKGLISAGCLETDVLARAESVLAGAVPRLALYDMGSELDLVWGTGMGCEGKVEVLLERVEPGPAPACLKHCVELLAARKTGVLVTVFDVRGQVPARSGDRYLFSEESGGTLPANPELKRLVIEAAQTALARGMATPSTLSLPQGELDLLLEPVLPPYALWICGAGEHGRPLARLAKSLGWFVGIVDHRPALATRERFPDADRIVVGHPPAVLDGLLFDRRSAALVISHVYEPDRRMLARLLETPLAYVGLQGNRRRCAKLLGEIAEEAGPLNEQQQARLYAPAGLDLGAEGPEAIALSMLAEVQAVLTGFPGGHLRDREGRIRNMG